jgi:hypothetical protein
VTKKNNRKYVMTLDGQCLMTTHTANNQKHVGAMERVYKRRCNQGGATRGDNIIVLGALEDERR